MARVSEYNGEYPMSIAKKAASNKAANVKEYRAYNARNSFTSSTGSLAARIRVAVQNEDYATAEVLRREFQEISKKGTAKKAAPKKITKESAKPATKSSKPVKKAKK